MCVCVCGSSPLAILSTWQGAVHYMCMYVLCNGSEFHYCLVCQIIMDNYADIINCIMGFFCGAKFLYILNECSVPKIDDLMLHEP